MLEPLHISCPECHALIDTSNPGDGGRFVCAECGFALTPMQPSQVTQSSTDGQPAPVTQFPEEWEIIRELGQGGMGRVCKARNRLTDEIVALKCVTPEHAADAMFRERFRREVQVMTRLRHPRVAQLLHAGIYCGLPWLALEYVDGDTLRTRISAGALPVHLSLLLAEQIGEALAYTHSQGVIHRDLKPENVMLHRTDGVKVLDFGLAAIRGVPCSGPEVTHIGTRLGTKGYMAPEQHRDPRSAGARSDLYSLGVILFEMVTGERPHGAESIPAPLVHVPPELDRLTTRLLDKDPERRPQSASEVLSALRLISADFAAREQGDEAGRQALAKASEDEARIRSGSKYHVTRLLHGEPAGFFVGSWSSGTMSIDRAGYRMCSNPGKDHFLTTWSCRLGRYREFVLTVHLSKVDGPDDSFLGLLFGDPWPMDFYEVLFTGSATLKLTRHLRKDENHEWTVLTELPAYPHLSTGNSANTIRLVKAEGSFHLFVNDHYATTVHDSSIPSGCLGFVSGPGVQVLASELSVLGLLDIDWLYGEGLRHIDILEPSIGHDLLRLVKAQEDGYRDVETRLGLQVCDPDRFQTIFVVVGSGLMPQVHDGYSAKKLLDFVNQEGAGYAGRFATLVTDTAFLQLPSDRQCAVIAVGGPVSNMLTQQLQQHLKSDPIGDAAVHVQHNLSEYDRRAALWGKDRQSTVDAVERFIGAGLLKQFLQSVWSTGAPC